MRFGRGRFLLVIGAALRCPVNGRFAEVALERNGRDQVAALGGLKHDSPVRLIEASGNLLEALAACPTARRCRHYARFICSRYFGVVRLKSGND
jgi:hypothetical protein